MNKSDAGTRARILVVDDVPENIRVIAAILSPLYDINFATSGTQTLDLLPRVQPDLLLLDLRMPDMNGLEVMRRMHTLDAIKDTPVIVISADAEGKQRDDALEAGALDVVQKPVVPADLRARVAGILAQSAANDSDED